MCTWFYADYHSLSYFISKAQQLPLAHEMMRKLGKNMAMSGNIRPTDTAVVLAPNKQGNMAVFPMVWGFTHEATPSRSSTAASKLPTRRQCGRIHGSGGGALSQLHGIMNGVSRPPKSVSAT